MADSEDTRSPGEASLDVVQDGSDQADAGAETSLPARPDEPAGAHVRLSALDEGEGDEVVAPGAGGAMIGDEEVAEATSQGSGMLGDEGDEEAGAAASEVLADAPSGPDVFARRIPLARFGIPVVSKLLIVLAVLVLVFSAVKVWAKARVLCRIDRERQLLEERRGSTESGDAVAAPEEASAAGSAFDIQKVLAAYAQRPIFRIPEEGGTTIGPTPESPLRSYDFIGIAGLPEDDEDVEAVIYDRSAKKLYFLSVGGKLPFGPEKQLTVTSITSKGVKLMDGLKELILE